MVAEAFGLLPNGGAWLRWFLDVDGSLGDFVVDAPVLLRLDALPPSALGL
jgi:hypothetical protein